MRILHEGTYHGIGQGQFYSGKFFCDNQNDTFNYVVDCGVIGEDAQLLSEINKYKKKLKDNLDLLIISHLDGDHFNGIAQFKGIEIDTIILPYLEPHEKLFLGSLMRNENTILSDFSSKDITASNFIIDPISTLVNLEINFNRIIFVLDENSFNNLEREELKYNHGSKNNKKIDFLAWSQIRFNNWTSNFIDFKFFRLPVESQKLKTLSNSVINGKMLREMTTKDIRNVLTTDKYLKKIRQEYKNIHKNLNDTSLCVSITAKSNYIITEYNSCIGNLPGTKFMPKIKNKDDSFGYMFTGDLNLKLKRNRNSFINHYSVELTKINFFTLPHHGSKYCWHKDLLKISQMYEYVTSSGYHFHYGHPHPEVLADIFMSKNKAVHQVNEMKSLIIKNFIY